MTDQPTIDPRSARLVARLEAAARRWWVPEWMSDLLIEAAAHIETQAEMERLLDFKLDRAREAAHATAA